MVAPGDTAFSRTFAAAQALQARCRTFVQQQCQRCEDQGISYLLYTADLSGMGRSLFPTDSRFQSAVTLLPPTDLDLEGQLWIYFTATDRAAVEDAVVTHQIRRA